MYEEDDYIQLSALQHHVFCPRQCALIHLEMIWAENRHTAEGRLLHEQADSGRARTCGNVRTVASLMLKSAELGLSGRADMVEFHREDGAWRPFPVEYKLGRPKQHDADRVQLCAQAMCLEEMLGVSVPAGALFYGRTRRRLAVTFDAALREETRRAAGAVHAMLESGVTPPPPADRSICRGCSLADECLPGMGRASASACLEAMRNMS